LKEASLRGDAPIRVGTIASLETRYKGIDVLLHALALAAQRDFKFTIKIVGDGRLKNSLEALAARLGISKAVLFAGSVAPGREIMNFLDGVDLYVQPSRTEGLPRAVIEAMSRGCPVIATRVGGIPSLVSESSLVEPDKPEELASKLIFLAENRDELIRQSRQNLRTAERYTIDSLRSSRVQFLRAIAEQ
jgi:glycosyltransferase involved in cell wall biosynthesis